MDTKEIDALIQLLDDPDFSVFQAIKIKFHQMGTAVIPHLEKAWENNLDELFQTRVENIIQEVHHSSIKKQLNHWIKTPNLDLIDAAILIAKFQYPDLDIEVLKKNIALIKKDIWLEINENLTALEKIKIVNHIFFDVHHYSRSNSFQNSAQSHFLSHLLETKKGSPIILAVLYAGICQQLNIPVSGVALPKNFILCYRDPLNQVFENEANQGVLFYINPFNKGVVFGKKEIEVFIKQQKIEHKTAYFQPISNMDTIIHLLKNIINYYEMNADKTKAENYQALLKILYF
jgi:regulator of sirC expression with transglutaminase-like and TPR domain